MPIKSHCSAFSLLEVLVASVLLATTLLIALSLQSNSLRELRSSYWQSVALFQLMSIESALHISQGKQLAALCQQWSHDNATRLPQGGGGCQCHSHDCRITLRWFYYQPFTRQIEMLF